MWIQGIFYLFTIPPVFSFKHPFCFRLPYGVYFLILWSCLLPPAHSLPLLSITKDKLTLLVFCTLFDVTECDIDFFTPTWYSLAIFYLSCFNCPWKIVALNIFNFNLYLIISVLLTELFYFLQNCLSYLPRSSWILFLSCNSFVMPSVLCCLQI